MRILIAGGGQTATLIASRLIREGNEIAIIEQDPERCQALEETLDARIIQANAASINTLRQAGIADAEMLIALTNVDQVNALVCLIASVESNARIRIIRLRTHDVEHWERIFRQADIPVDLIIHPESDIAERILRIVRIPAVLDVLDFSEGRVKLFGMSVENGSWIVNKNIKALSTDGPRRNCLVTMIFRGQQAIIPHGSDILRVGDHIYVVTPAEHLEATYRFMGLHTQGSLERVFILGGKQIGIGVAEQLENIGVTVKLFEKNAERCDLISKILQKSIVLHADGTDEAILRKENVDGVGAFLALTGHDEDNIMASLLARKLGAKKVITLIHRLDYLPIVERLEIPITVNPRLAAVDRVLRYVRKGRVISVTSFREEEAEAIELVAASNSKYINTNVKDLHLPHDSIIGAISRSNSEVIIPRGHDSIQSGDRVIFFALESSVPILESAFLTEAGD